jgi:hypothetical protein
MTTKITILKSDYLMIWELLDKPQMFYDMPIQSPYYYNINLTEEQLDVLRKNKVWFDIVRC